MEITWLIYQGDGVYDDEAYLTPGVYEFKFASSDWEQVDLGFDELTNLHDSIGFAEAKMATSKSS